MLASIHFTSHLIKHVECPSAHVAADTVGEALEVVFTNNPPLRSYILDDQARLRQHVVVFVDGKTIVDRVGLSDPIGTDSEIYVMQALSGG